MRVLLPFRTSSATEDRAGYRIVVEEKPDAGLHPLPPLVQGGCLVQADQDFRFDHRGVC